MTVTTMTMVMTPTIIIAVSSIDSIVWYPYNRRRRSFIRLDEQRGHPATDVPNDGLPSREGGLFLRICGDDIGLPARYHDARRIHSPEAVRTWYPSIFHCHDG